MKKYKNISKTTLALDCIIKTVYMRPGEVLTLPRSRDVRYYAGLRKLQMIRDKKEEQVLVLKKEPIKEKSHLGEGAKSKALKAKEKASNKQEEIEDNKINNDMEIK